METPDCNLCGSPPSAHRRVLEGQDRLYGTAGRFTVVRCTVCRLSFVSPRPSQDEIAGYYPDEYGEHSAPATEANAFAAAGAAIVARHRPTPGSILDVGCASGGFLRAMAARQWMVNGIELDESAAASAATVPGARIHNGWVDDAPFADESFDVVSAWSVVEHLHDPLGDLARCRALMRPGGLLFLGLPNFASMERAVFRDRWFALDVPRHLYHFSPATLRALLEKAGLSVVSVDQASGHDTFRWSVQLRLGRTPSLASGRGGASATRPDDRPRLRAAASALKGRAVGALTGTADRLGYGSQMLVVARR